MYCLPQAGRYAYDKLVKCVAKHSYVPIATTPGLFKHKGCPIQFTLVVDDFSGKYTNIDSATHLIKCIEEMYEIIIDWDGKVYCGIHLKWNYK